jgi:hypothetical protein
MTPVGVFNSPLWVGYRTSAVAQSRFGFDLLACQLMDQPAGVCRLVVPDLPISAPRLSSWPDILIHAE